MNPSDSMLSRTPKPATGYVATLDVLGFSDMLYRDTYLKELEEYIGCMDGLLREIMNSGGESSPVECLLFSDSIVLTSRSVAEEDGLSFGRIVQACSAAQHVLIARGVPVRGVIAYGSFWRSESNGSVFLAGRPIVEAYRLEKALKWVGTMLASSVLHHFPAVRNICRIPNKAKFRAEIDQGGSWELAFRIQPATVYFSDSSCAGDVEGYGVVPLMAATSSFDLAAKNVRATLQRLFALQEKCPNPIVQQKYQRTIDWLEKVAESYADAADVERQVRSELG